MANNARRPILDLSDPANWRIAWKIARYANGLVVLMALPMLGIFVKEAPTVAGIILSAVIAIAFINVLVWIGKRHIASKTPGQRVANSTILTYVVGWCLGLLIFPVLAFFVYPGALSHYLQAHGQKTTASVEHCQLNYSGADQSGSLITISMTIHYSNHQTQLTAQDQSKLSTIKTICAQTDPQIPVVYSSSLPFLVALNI